MSPRKEQRKPIPVKELKIRLNIVLSAEHSRLGPIAWIVALDQPDRRAMTGSVSIRLTLLCGLNLKGGNLPHDF
jgi:hypothetical protein